MGLIILFPAVACLVALATGSVRREFLNVYLPVRLLRPQYYILRLPHLPPLTIVDMAMLSLGAAFRFGFKAAMAAGANAFLVMDADSGAAPMLIEVTRLALEEGAEATQCRYELELPGAGKASLLARLRMLAFRGINVLRARGRARLGFSAGLFGNGFTLTSETLGRVPFSADSICEDLEYHIKLVCGGIRVQWVEDAFVHAPLAASGSVQAMQEARWEGGRLFVASRATGRILWAILHGNWRALEMLAEVWSLPLSRGILTLLPAAAHVDAASGGPDRMRNLGELYLSGSRYANVCTAVFVAAITFWSTPILHVWLGPELPMRETLIPLFVVFSLAMQLHMLTGPGTSIFRGMGRVYEEFSYSIPNVVLLAVTLPAARWIEGRWTPFGIGGAVSLATAGSACVLMARALYVLEVKLARFVRVVLIPGVAPYVIAGLLAWPAARLVAAVNRWQGAGVLLVVGLIYAAGVIAVLHKWVLTSEEKQKGLELIRKGLGIFGSREATV